MADCCDFDCEVSAGASKQRVTLWLVLVINAVMFIVLLVGSVLGNTVSLFADSFDNLGDAITYAISIWAVGKGSSQKAKVSIFKGLLILAAGIAVAVSVVFKVINPVLPVYEVMGALSIASLIANGICLGLLWRHRNEDINMESVWHCSRNDIVTNLSVFAAAGFVWYYNSWIPDMLVAAALSLFLLNSGRSVMLKSLRTLKESA